jgi:hypothetical protein
MVDTMVVSLVELMAALLEHRLADLKVVMSVERLVALRDVRKAEKTEH